MTVRRGIEERGMGRRRGLRLRTATNAATGRPAPTMSTGAGDSTQPGTPRSALDTTDPCAGIRPSVTDADGALPHAARCLQAGVVAVTTQAVRVARSAGQGVCTAGGPRRGETRR